MASFYEHIAFSSLLGLGYGLGATFGLEFTPVQGALAGYLAAFGGMLPDLDSPNGKPGRELFALTGALAPLVSIGHVLRLTGLEPKTETVMLLIVAMYFFFRYGVAWLVNKFSVHRGMFHSFPAMAIVAEAVFLLYPSDSRSVQLLMAGAIACGFFSHLLLDEIYAIQWQGAIPKFKKSFGTAMKFTSNKAGPTILTYGLLAATTFILLQDIELVSASPIEQPVAGEEVLPPDDFAPVDPRDEVIAPDPVTRSVAVPREELDDAPLFQ